MDAAKGVYQTIQKRLDWAGLFVYRIARFQGGIMKKIRFLHMADLHYGARVASDRLGLDTEKVTQRKREERKVLQRCIDIALSEKVDVVLLPGDLYDFRATSLSTAGELFDSLRKLGDVPVFIAPGNHDYYSSSSFYNADYLLARRQNPIPANVIIFKNFSFEGVVPPTCADVCVSGFAYAGFTNTDERPLQAKIKRDESRVNILLLHGWFEMMKVDLSKQTSPFSL